MKKKKIIALTLIVLATGLCVYFLIAGRNGYSVYFSTTSDSELAMSQDVTVVSPDIASLSVEDIESLDSVSLSKAINKNHITDTLEFDNLSGKTLEITSYVLVYDGDVVTGDVQDNGAVISGTIADGLEDDPNVIFHTIDGLEPVTKTISIAEESYEFELELDIPYDMNAKNIFVMEYIRFVED